MSGDDSEKDKNSFLENISLSDSLGLDSTEARIYLLPAPLQVATVLKNFKQTYSTNILYPLQPHVPYSSNYVKAMALGIYMIDLGYTVVYEDIQNSINYMKKIKQIMSELAMTTPYKESLLKRFESNINNKDSLFTILLTLYQNSHEYFKENEKEGLSLLIMTGAYLEGLYIATSMENLPQTTELASFIQNQKLYLDNIIELITFYTSKDEQSTLLKKLKYLDTELTLINDRISSTKELQRHFNPTISKVKLKNIYSIIDSIRLSLTI